MPYEIMTHDDSTSPSLGGFGSPQADDIISLNSNNSSSSSSSADDPADLATPDPSPSEVPYSGGWMYHCKPNNHALPSSMREKAETFHEQAAAGASKTPITGVDDKGNDQAMDDQARGRQSKFTAILHEIMLNLEADKYENARLHFALEQQSKRLEDVSNKFTDGLVSRVAQLETTLANLTLQKTPPDIHVDVHMPPHPSSSTTADDTPPRRPSHDEGRSDGHPDKAATSAASDTKISSSPPVNRQSTSPLVDGIQWAKGCLRGLQIMRQNCKVFPRAIDSLDRAKVLSVSAPDKCRESLFHICGQIEFYTLSLSRRVEDSNAVWEADVLKEVVNVLKKALDSSA
ncbi:hypothetical protein L198_07446 [Cryptococcus wingfieldii CBS 7118]|uniref:Uncharacterized protein n=1 Tax=Cryptococcus wingfieldii CBS 7118 TaxID=1295528 RepID=A0A1E3IDQ3_9TREE|nr:hypothetical protein L198_07446 [Cryptococcus wingfieldii CBS 7118]ODN85881.1 hypothetical protein L198_07446 [Cryptococcus wingfieldii CBS 7118]